MTRKTLQKKPKERKSIHLPERKVDYHIAMADDMIRQVDEALSRSKKHSDDNK